RAGPRSGRGQSRRGVRRRIRRRIDLHDRTPNKCSACDLHHRTACGAEFAAQTPASTLPRVKGDVQRIAQGRGYLEACAAAAAAIEGTYDVLVLHDPAALGLAEHAPGTLVWRCHLDVEAPDPPVLERTTGPLERCAAVVVPSAQFAPPGLSGDR